MNTFLIRLDLPADLSSINCEGEYRTSCVTTVFRCIWRSSVMGNEGGADESSDRVVCLWHTWTSCWLHGTIRSVGYMGSRWWPIETHLFIAEMLIWFSIQSVFSDAPSVGDQQTTPLYISPPVGALYPLLYYGNYTVVGTWRWSQGKQALLLFSLESLIQSRVNV